MATTSRYLVAPEELIPTIHTWLKDHPLLDPRGGGDKSFSVKLNLLSDPIEHGSTIRARRCQWTLPDSWWDALKDKFALQEWTLNSPDVADALINLSHYPAPPWTEAAVDADKTRKAKSLQIIEGAAVSP